MIAESAAAATMLASGGERTTGGGARGPKMTKKMPSVQFLKMLIGGTNESDLILERGSSSCMLKIMDLRPKSSAMANRTAGENSFCVILQHVFFYSCN